jgi:hypothetical protein
MEGTDDIHLVTGTEPYEALLSPPVEGDHPPPTEAVAIIEMFTSASRSDGEPTTGPVGPVVSASAAVDHPHRPVLQEELELRVVDELPNPRRARPALTFDQRQAAATHGDRLAWVDSTPENYRSFGVRRGEGRPGEDLATDAPVPVGIEKRCDADPESNTQTQSNNWGPCRECAHVRGHAAPLPALVDFASFAVLLAIVGGILAADAGQLRPCPIPEAILRAPIS